MSPFHHARLHRRDTLRLMCAGGASWLTGLGTRLAIASEQAPRREPAGAVIMLWLAGGPSQLETFDPHPGSDIAAGSTAIGTRAKGVQLAAGLERLADQLDVVSLVRSLHSREGDHERGVYLTKTGYRPDPTLTHPTLGAVICRQLPDIKLDIPTHVSLLPNEQSSWGGYLGAQYDAFRLGEPGGKLPDMTSPVEPLRTNRRTEALSVIERTFAAGRESQLSKIRHWENIQHARRMMNSEQLKAFEIDDEPAELRARYGDHPFGRGCLVARRLVEAGVPCVEVTLGGWDTHFNNHELHRGLVGVLDPAFATLVADLRQRDLLRNTIVICGGEFGRTPQVNSVGGRDHWPHNFTWALAGGGFAGGIALGETDPQGGTDLGPDGGYTVADIHATIQSALGLDPELELMTPIDRPIKLSEGRPIDRLLG